MGIRRTVRSQYNYQSLMNYITHTPLLLQRALSINPSSTFHDKVLSAHVGHSSLSRRLVKGPLEKILDRQPTLEIARDLGVTRLQAFLRGVRTRRDLLSGLKRKLRVRGAIMVHERHPVLLTVQTDLGGRIRELVFQETLTGDCGTLSLPFCFAPSLRLVNSGDSQLSKLTMSIRKERFPQLMENNSIVDLENDSALATEGSFESFKMTERHVITLSFLDKKRRALCSISMNLSFLDSEGLTPRLDLRAGDEYHESFMAKSVLDFVTVDDQPIVLTSVEQLVVARGMHCHEGFLFFFRIYNTADKLNILISYGGAPFRLHFIFPREHISLNIDARYIVRKTFRLIDELSCLAYILLGQWLGEEKRIRCGVKVDNMSLMVSVCRDPEGAVVHCCTLSGKPFYGHRFEVVPKIRQHALRVAASLDLTKEAQRAQYICMDIDEAFLSLKATGQRALTFLELRKLARHNIRIVEQKRLRTIATRARTHLELRAKTVDSQRRLAQKALSVSATRALSHLSLVETGAQALHTEKVLFVKAAKERAQKYLAHSGKRSVTALSLRDTGAQAIEKVKIDRHNECCDKSRKYLFAIGAKALAFDYLRDCAAVAICYLKRREAYAALVANGCKAVAFVHLREIGDDAKTYAHRQHVHAQRLTAFKYLRLVARKQIAHEDMLGMAEAARIRLKYFAPMHPRGDMPRHIQSLAYVHATTITAISLRAAQLDHIRLAEIRRIRIEKETDALAEVVMSICFENTVDELLSTTFERKLNELIHTVDDTADRVVDTVYKTVTSSVSKYRKSVMDILTENICDELLRDDFNKVIRVHQEAVHVVASKQVSFYLESAVAHDTKRVTSTMDAILDLIISEVSTDKLYRVGAETIATMKAEAKAEERTRREMFKIECQQRDQEACLRIIRAHQREVVNYIAREREWSALKESEEESDMDRVINARSLNFHNSLGAARHGRVNMLVPQGSGRLRTMLFLAHQNKRMDAADYLIRRATQASVVVNRIATQKILRDKAKAAIAMLAAAAAKAVPESEADGGEMTPEKMKGSPSRRGSTLSVTSVDSSSSRVGISINPDGYASSGMPKHVHRQEYEDGEDSPVSPNLQSDDGAERKVKLPTDPLGSAEELLQVLGVSNDQLFPKRYPFLDFGPPTPAFNSPSAASLFSGTGTLENPSLLPPRKGTGRRNPVQFMGAEERPQAQSTFADSIEQFRRMGYSNGECEYMQRWLLRLEATLDSFTSPQQLDRVLSKLQHCHSEPLSRAEALCALADTGGSLNEAMGRLLDPDFGDEVRLVCSVLPVERMVGTGTDREGSRNGSRPAVDTPPRPGQKVERWATVVTRKVPAAVSKRAKVMSLTTPASIGPVKVKGRAKNDLSMDKEIAYSMTVPSANKNGPVESSSAPSSRGAARVTTADLPPLKNSAGQPLAPSPVKGFPQAVKPKASSVHLDNTIGAILAKGDSVLVMSQKDMIRAREELALEKVRKLGNIKLRKERVGVIPRRIVTNSGSK